MHKYILVVIGSLELIAGQSVCAAPEIGSVEIETFTFDEVSGRPSGIVETPEGLRFEN